jgi:cbb3-type cytochrome oxidase cytochrome c subunit
MINAQKEKIMNDNENTSTDVMPLFLQEMVKAARLAELEACVEYLESLHQLQSSHNYYRNAALKLLAERGPK